MHTTVSPDGTHPQFVPAAETKVKSVGGGNVSVSVTAPVALGPALLTVIRYWIVPPAGTAWLGMASVLTVDRSAPDTTPGVIVRLLLAGLGSIAVALPIVAVVSVEPIAIAVAA